MKTPAILTILFLAFHFNTNGQVKKFYSGIGIEIGGGYNTARWKSNGIDFRRNQPFFKPTARINCEFKLFKLSDSRSIKLRPFFGYYTFGGKSRERADGYKDFYTFRSLEAGLIPSLTIKEKLQLGVGVKALYILDARINYSYLDSGTRDWGEVDLKDFFTRYGVNIGINFRYKLRHFTIGAESWFGISNLSLYDPVPKKHKVKENNFRILVGFEL